jgi:hypothetical protein
MYYGQRSGGDLHHTIVVCFQDPRCNGCAFENANFEDHPSISSEYAKFLAMNSGFEALEAVTGKLKIMLDQVKDMQASVKQADKKAENAVSFCDANKKSYEALNKRMPIQEGKK